MNIYLPIAEVSINLFVIVGLGGIVGFMSGMFGVGGGFLMTPLLIFFGVPAPVAVSTEANQIVASSVSGVIAHWKKGYVDIKMGVILLVGGLFGSSVGVFLFSFLKQIGQIDFVVKVSYVFFLGIIGILMFYESSKSILNLHKISIKRKKLHQHNWLHGLPFKVRFRKSKLYISALLPLILSAMVGVLSAIMGVGGGFILVPAMIYLLGMPTYVVVGTSLFQIIFVTANITILQSIQTQTVDFVLAALLIMGGVIGAQIGARFMGLIRGEYLRALLSIIVLAVAVKILIDLIGSPNNVFSTELIK